jgi:hypothetical protein
MFKNDPQNGTKNDDQADRLHNIPESILHGRYDLRHRQLNAQAYYKAGNQQREKSMYPVSGGQQNNQEDSRDQADEYGHKGMMHSLRVILLFLKRNRKVNLSVHPAPAIHLLIQNIKSPPCPYPFA